MTAPADYVLELPREGADLTLYRGRQPGTLNRAVSFSVWSRGAKPRFHRHHRDHDRRLTNLHAPLPCWCTVCLLRTEGLTVEN